MARIVVRSYPRSSKSRSAASTIRARVASGRRAWSSGTGVTVVALPGQPACPRVRGDGEDHASSEVAAAQPRQPFRERAVPRRRPEAGDPAGLGNIDLTGVGDDGDLVAGPLVIEVGVPSPGLDRVPW